MQKIFDSHFHIIDPQYPLVENQGFLPDYYTVEEYRRELESMGLELAGGAVVSGSFQGFDQSYFEGTLAKLGKSFVGVTQLNPAADDAEIRRLDQIGIKNIRFNLFRGFNSSLQEIEKLSNRVYDLCGWKTELYLDASQMDEAFLALVFRLPKVSIDHLGMRRCEAERLKRFVSKGVPIRVTGFGRVDYSREEVQQLLAELYRENSGGLLFGSDLPSTRARYRFSVQDIRLIQEALGEEHAQNVLYHNGVSWYL